MVLNFAEKKKRKCVNKGNVLTVYNFLCCLLYNLFTIFFFFLNERWRLWWKALGIIRVLKSLIFYVTCLASIELVKWTCTIFIIIYSNHITVKLLIYLNICCIFWETNICPVHNQEHICIYLCYRFTTSLRSMDRLKVWK